MSLSQSSSIFRAELVTPQSNRFARDNNSTLSQQIFNIVVAEIEPKVEPHRILDDFRRESVSFVQFLTIHLPIIAYGHLTWQYPK
jgi:hypothetical protein